MLLQPTAKYIDYITNSWHYLNCPKCLFNESINSLVRGYSKERAMQNVRSFFQQYKHSIKNIEAIVNYHLSVKIKQFSKLNVNTYVKNPPPHVTQITEKINNWMNAHRVEPTIFNRYPKQPDYPMKY